MTLVSTGGADTIPITVGMVLSNSIKCMNMDHETIVLSSIVTVVEEWGEKIIRCVSCRQTQQPLLFMHARTLIVSTQCALSLATLLMHCGTTVTGHRYIQVLDKWIGH